MKKNIKSCLYLFTACCAILLSSCQKKVTDLKPVPPVDETILNAMYPVTQSFDNGPKIYTYTFTYNNDNHLVKYTRNDNIVGYNIGTNQVDQTVNEFRTGNDGQPVLSHISVTSYVYTLAGTPDNTSVDIFNTAPTQVKFTHYNKDVSTGVTNSTPGGLIQFYNSKAGFPVKITSSDGGGYNYNYTYDDKDNIIKAEFVNLSGPRASAVFQRITFSSFDDKRSPFSAVKGYWPASYPQSDVQNYALAFCKNNPKQIISEHFNVEKNKFEVYQQDDFSYVYNDKGYPTQIKINTTYITAVTTHDTRTYNYTYK